MKSKNYLMISLVVIGAILFGVVSYVIVRSNRTVTAVVPAEEIKVGQIIEESMLVEIQVPVGTPRNFIVDKSSLVGQKLKINAQPGQLLYMSDIMTSWNDMLYGTTIPDDYIITSINVPNERAVGGIIIPGDTVDVLGVPKDNELFGVEELDKLNMSLGPISDYSYGADGIHLYWILANVKILETNSSLSLQTEESFLGSVDNMANNQNESSYIVALSYQDYQKLILAQQYLDIWLNLSPIWNNDNPPLLDLMKYSEIKSLMDAQAQSIIEEIKESEDGKTEYKLKPEALEELEEAKERWELRHQEKLQREHIRRELGEFDSEALSETQTESSESSEDQNE